MMQAKLTDGWQFPRVRYRSNWTGRFCCIGVAVPRDTWRKDDGQLSHVHYECEFGHSWSMFVDNGELKDLDRDRIVEDDREIEQRWACRQCTDDRGRPKLVIWPVSTEVCPHCEQGTRYDCVDCGEQLCTDQLVHREDDGFVCDSCCWDRHTVPASEVEV